MSETPETYEAVERWRQGKINVFDEMARLERERDEAIAARKASAADWLNQIEQANARTTRALQQTVLAERERDEAREALEIERAEHSITELERDEAIRALTKITALPTMAVDQNVVRARKIAQEALRNVEGAK